jgi:hypothetical protein
MDGVAHPHHRRSSLREVFAGAEPRVEAPEVPLSDRLEVSQVLGRGDGEEELGASLMGMALDLEVDAIRGGGKDLEIPHQLVVPDMPLAHLESQDTPWSGGRRIVVDAGWKVVAEAGLAWEQGLDGGRPFGVERCGN